MEIFDRAPFREVEENSKGAPALSEAKIVRTGVERERIDLFTTTEKGDKETFFSLVCTEGKIEQRNRMSARKRHCGSGLSKQLCTASTSSI